MGSDAVLIQARLRFGSAFALDGRMVDAPVVEQARRILSREQALSAQR